MRHIVIISCFLLISSMISCAGNPRVSAEETAFTGSDSAKKDHPQKMILVRFKPGTDTNIIKTIQNKLGLETVRALNVPDLYLMKITGEISTEVVIEELIKYSEVLYAEPNQKYQINGRRGI